MDTAAPTARRTGPPAPGPRALPRTRHALRRRAVGAGAALVLAAASLLVTGAGAASAAPTAAAPAASLPGPAGLLDTGGPAGLPATVTSTPLPTVQVDGVVWAQAVVGTTVYVTGEFTSARPAGAAPGTGETPRANALAYDVRTGRLLPWAPALNAQGLAVAASPDGDRVYLGGDFTAVDGQDRFRIVAVDATSGSLDPGFVPGVNSRVRSLAAVGTTVYAGGVFTQAGSVPRRHLAAFAADGGAVTTWDPSASVDPADLTRPDPARPATPEVMAMTAPAGTGTLVVGGRFTRLSGTPAFGIGALDLVTGAPRPFATDQVVRDAGQSASITDLASQDGTVYGSGYVFGADGNLENTFAADADSGEVSWVNGCLGDTYSVAPVGPVLYSAGHAHDCSMIGGHPEKNPRDYQRAVATTSAPSPLGRTDHAGPFAGRAAPELLHWMPQLDAGTYTGQTQGPWSVRAADGYVVMAGEFPRVNGVPQQGLVRFAAPGAAPAATDADKPIGYTSLTPAPATVQPGRVRLGWQAAWDRDSAALTYELLRGREVVATQVVPSTFALRPPLSAVDAEAPAGEVSYRVRVTDGSGRTMTSPATVVDVPAGATDPAPGTAFTEAVDADAPVHHWRLDEAADGPLAAVALDRAGAADLGLPASAVRGTSGPSSPASPADPADAAPGATTFVSGAAVTAVAENGPQSFSQEVWLRTTTSTGGKILGLESRRTGASPGYDRQLWMGDDGRVSFGVNDGRLQVLRTPAPLNDGAWHQVVSTLNGGTVELSVDGVLVDSADGVRQAQAFDGWWRVGGGTTARWPSAPTTPSFAGDLADVVLYRAPLSAERVAAHHAAGTVPVVPPTDPAVPPVEPTPPVDPPPVDPPVDPVPPVDPPVDPPAPPAPPVDPPADPDPPVEPPVVPAGAVLAADDFARTTAAGLGTATTGGPWSTSPSSAFAVADGAGRLTLAPGRSANARLGEATDVGVDVRLTLDVVKPEGRTAWVSVLGRAVGPGDDYRAKVRSGAGGRTDLALVARTGGSERTLASTALPRTVAVAGAPLTVHLQVVPEGDGVALRASAWSPAAGEPAAWQLEATDATAALRAPGTVGLWSYLSRLDPAGPMTVSLDDLSVTALPAAG